MKRKLNTLSYLYLFFLALLFLSGGVSGFLGEVVYLLAFLLPLGIGIYLSRDEYPTVDFKMDREKVNFTLPLIIPTVAVTLLLSYLTGLLIFVTTGRVNSVDMGDSFLLAIISHAIMPAVLEELLFRYLPIRFLADRSERLCIFASAFFFSLVHHDLFSIHYTFVAGMILMSVDIATESILPSILIHFINNALSVCMVMYGDNPVFLTSFYSLIAILTVVSVIIIVIRRKKYAQEFETAFYCDERLIFTLDMWIFLGITMTLAIIQLM